MKVFSTPRLDAREAEERDIDWIISVEKDPENNRFIWLGTPEQHLKEIKGESTHLLVFEDKNGDKVGYCLSESHPFRTFELRRIAITKKGKGYGKEAMKGMFDYAFNQCHAHRLWLDVYPDNKIGIQLYESLGMHRDGELRDSYLSEDGEFRNQIIYSLLAPEWKK
ncbi:MAG: GNAT family protein [Tissierellia bacterium]|nr:GNAT family protein [Tissierellia bacterium]